MNEIEDGIIKAKSKSMAQMMKQALIQDRFYKFSYLFLLNIMV